MGKRAPKKVEDKVETAVIAEETPVTKVTQADDQVSDAETAEEQTAEQTAAVKKVVRVRSKKYVQARGNVNKTKQYTAEEAVALLKKIARKQTGSLEAHLVVKETGITSQVEFPFSTGRAVKAAVASDELIAEIEKGVLDFTVLVAHPSFMPKLAKLARVLGPKGLMPNPKNGTVTPNPEQKKKELEKGAVLLKTERKAPLMHVVVGKMSQSEDELSANLTALLTSFQPGRLLRCSIAASMSPSIRVLLA